LADKYTKIPNEFIWGNNKLESDKLFLLTILFQGRTMKDISYFNVKYLCKRLSTTTSNINRTKYIINTMKYFQDNKIFAFSDKPDASNDIDIEQELNKDKTGIYFAELYYSMDGKYTIIKDQEIELILNICENNKLDKYKMFHMYLYILSCINNNETDEEFKLARPSLNTISNVVDISETTILKYIEVLNSENILYYDCIGYKIVNGKYKMTNTYYCRIENKELLDKLIQKKKQEVGINVLTSKDKNKTNKKRSLKQKINKLYKKESKTDKDIELLKQLTDEYEKMK
jgi:hypothetical protein